jgi:hypothetical protein
VEGGKDMNRKRFVAIVLAVVLALPVGFNMPVGMGQVEAAEEFTVTESNAVLYSTRDGVQVFSKPDASSTIVTALSDNVPVRVTGVTSNGWFRVSIDGTYYIQGDGLKAADTDSTNTQSGSATTSSTSAQTLSATELSRITQGTFSFYKNSALSKMDKDDVDDMDENTYIKYLDSFLMGYAMLDYCILQDSGKYLKEVYDDQTKYTSMQSYLIDYRNNYFSDSLIGPFRSEKELKRALNRSIRYDIGEFNSVYKNSNVGSEDEEKIDKLVKGVVEDINAEQGVTFTYKLKYGTYNLSDGSDGKGWIISFTKKD